MPKNDTVNRRVVLAARPRGLPTLQDSRLEEAPVPTPSEGDLLLRTLHLSLDPYMRNLMEEIGPTYAPSLLIGELMVGGKWLGAGWVKLREDPVDGLENACCR